MRTANIRKLGSALEMVPVITFCKYKLTPTHTSAHEQASQTLSVEQSRRTEGQELPYLKPIRQHPQLFLSVAVQQHLQPRHELQRLVVLRHNLDVLLIIFRATVLETQGGRRGSIQFNHPHNNKNINKTHPAGERKWI